MAHLKKDYRAGDASPSYKYREGCTSYYYKVVKAILPRLANQKLLITI